METFNRLAGVRDVSSKPLPPPPPIPHEEPSDQALSRRASRASLPRDLHRSPSRKSLRSSKYAPSRRSQEDIPPVPATPHTAFHSTREESGDSEPQQTGRPSNASAETEEEFEWGPSHPCYPHPNPHCLPESEAHQHTRVIRVKRDWLISSDLYPQYQNLYPDILDPLVSDTDFRLLITTINTKLERIFNPWRSSAWIDALLGVLTGFLWDDVGFTTMKRGIRDLESYIETWNAQKVQEKQEVKLIQLRRTGFISLDFVIPDPGLDVIDPRERQSKEQT